MKTRHLLLALALALGLMLALGLSLGPGDSLADSRQPAAAPLVGELVGHLGVSNAGVFIVGHRAYVTLGPELAVLDISDPAHPRRIGSAMLSGDGGRVYVAAGYAYVASYEGNTLWIVDVSTPANLLLVGSYQTQGMPAIGVHVAGGFAYLVGWDTLEVVDVSDPTNPALDGSCADMGNSNWDVYVLGDYAYVVGDTGLHVVDVSDPEAPVEVGSLAGYSTGIHVVGQYAYLTDFEITVKSQLRVVDVSEPTQPQQVGAVEGLFGVDGPWGELDDVYVAGDYAYVSGVLRTGSGLYVGGLQIVDISSPTTPQLRETYLRDEIRYPRQVGVSGSHAFLAAREAGLHVINVADPDHPTGVGVYPVTARDNTAILVSGDYAYLSSKDHGTVDMVSVSDPANPVLVGRYQQEYSRLASEGVQSPSAVGVTGLALDPPYLYQVGYSGLRVVNVSNPAQPQEVGRYDVSSGTDVAVAGGIACLTSYEHGLRVLDVSDPSQPTLLASYADGEWAWAVAISDSKAYLAINDELRILDIADPASPTQIGAYHAPDDYVYDLFLAGSYAYLSAADALRIVDVADPQQPQEAGAITGDWKAFSFDAARNYLYIGGEEKLRVMDVSDPSAPVEVWAYGIGVNGGYVVGDYVYVVNGGGMSILRLAPLSLSVTPPTVSWLAAAGGADPAPRTLNIESSGSPLTWTVTLSPTVGWLTVAPLSGTTPAVLTATAHISGLAVSRYTSTLVLSSPLVSSPLSVPVTLLVAEEVHSLYLPLVLRGYAP